MSRVENSGLECDYYWVDIELPVRDREQYTAEAQDIMEALNMTFTEGTIFKSLWRKAAERQGRRKLGNSAYRDAQKIKFYGERLLDIETLKENGGERNDQRAKNTTQGYPKWAQEKKD
jgi:hypothetical protein